MKANQTANKIYQRAQAFYHSPILALGLNAGNCYHNSIIMEDVWNYGHCIKTTSGHMFNIFIGAS